MISPISDTHADTEPLLDILYSRPVASTRIGELFNAHSYPTKINPRAVMPFILAHTRPGETVFDGFSGSGAVGLAAALCSAPETDAGIDFDISQPGGQWGARRAILYDVSVLATFMSSSLLDPPDPQDFELAAKEILRAVQHDWGWMYEATELDDLEGGPGCIRYTLWTDHPKCPQCETISTYWDLAVSWSPLQLRSDVTCHKCSHVFDVSSAARATEEYTDDVLGETRTRRVRTPAFVYGRTGKSLWKRPVSQADRERLERIESTPIPPGVPIAPMTGAAQGEGGRWGELYRSGYHYGITHMHHFYTRRNLIAIASAWRAADAYPTQIANALRLWISSYNAPHSTLMTRVVCKEKAKEFVVTSAQPGALYVGSLPVEKNVFLGLQKKLSTVRAAFEKTRGLESKVEVHCGSSLDVALPDESVDYIFTDPPFGDNIQYSEVNFISEAWLGRTTETQEEAIVSAYQNKSVDHYGALLAGAFSEAYRILKSGRYMTVVFHSTRPEVWNALRMAWERAGFLMVRSSILDKTQSSFKQTTTNGAVQGDPVILLQKPGGERRSNAMPGTVPGDRMMDTWDLIADRLDELGKCDSGVHVPDRTKQRLYSYAIRYYLQKGEPIPFTAASFFAGLDRLFVEHNGQYFATR